MPLQTESRKISTDLVDDPAAPMRSVIDSDALEELASSIKRDGLINPITVRAVGGRYEVIAGHRRLAASRRAGLAEVPCVVRDSDDAATLRIRLHENANRADVDPLDEACFIAEAMDKLNSTPEEIGGVLNRSKQYVQARLELLSYPDYLQQALKERKMSLGAASWLARIEDDGVRRMWVDIAARDGITTTNAERWFLSWRTGLYAGNQLPQAAEGQRAAVSMRDSFVACEKCAGPIRVGDHRLVYIHRDCPVSVSEPDVSNI